MAHWRLIWAPNWRQMASKTWANLWRDVSLIIEKIGKIGFWDWKNGLYPVPSVGHPKYLLIFNYGIGIKTGIHFQLRNWLRNWEFGPKVAKIAKFLQNSWQAWICEMLWCHFFHFNAKFKSFNNRILKRKKFGKYIFLKNVKIAQFLAKSGQF